MQVNVLAPPLFIVFYIDLSSTITNTTAAVATVAAIAVTIGAITVSTAIFFEASVDAARGPITTITCDSQTT